MYSSEHFNISQKKSQKVKKKTKKTLVISNKLQCIQIFIFSKNLQDPKKKTP